MLRSLSWLLDIASVRTKKCSQSPSDSELSFFVGQGKEFLHSEVPTLRAVIQRGILIKEGLILEQGAAKKDIHVKQIVDQLVPLIFAQWQISANIQCQKWRIITRGTRGSNRGTSLTSRLKHHHLLSALHCTEGGPGAPEYPGAAQLYWILAIPLRRLHCHEHRVEGGSPPWKASLKEIVLGDKSPNTISCIYAISTLMSFH